MLSSFRRMSKSAVGTGIIALVGLLIMIGFAVGDIQSLNIGGAALSESTLAEAGSHDVTDRDMSAALQRRLGQVRQQNPEATYASLAGDFDPILQSLIDQRALEAFAEKHGFVLSKRLVDAEIAKIPGVKGLNGQVTQESYQAWLARERMTDAELRDLISGSLLARLLVTPAATTPQLPIGVATPYASMLLEAREGQVALVPVAAFAKGLSPSDAQLQQYYQANRNRYMVPEQRVLKLAKIGPEQVGDVNASDQEIQAYYNSHQDEYGSKDIRTINQAVVPDRAAANAIAQRVKGGQGFADAVKPAGLGAADISVGAVTRKDFAELAGDKVAAAAWGAKAGSVVGPVQSDLGWHVVQVESQTVQKGKSLAEARSEIAAKIATDKRKNALADLVNNVQDSIDEGANFDEAAKRSKLPVTITPAITARGIARGNQAYAFPADLAPALKGGFELAPTDEPVVETLENDAGYVLVAPAQVIPAAPAPLASIRDRVTDDWIHAEASARALALARKIASAAGGNTALADAAKQSGDTPVPIERARAVRIQLSQMGDKVPAPLKTLFATAQGKATVGADPQGRGYYVVKVDKITPGNALNQPRLISEVQAQFAEPLAQEYAQQLGTAAKQSVTIRRNEPAIEATKKRIISGGS